MSRKHVEKAPVVAAKSFMAVGPTLHYSHINVQRCWFLAIIVFSLTCLLWSKIATGSMASFDPNALFSLEAWRLDRLVLSGVSIFEYPWQILVLGLLMGVLAIAPILVSQLMSFSYSLPFILAVFFLTNLPGFALSLLVSCVGAACRPLRFRSRIIAIALCMAPQLIYWWFLGGAEASEPLVWGFSFSPWVCAWLVGLALAGVVLGIGHYTRYKPGLVWTSTGLVLVVTLCVFETQIGFDELAFQLHVAKNDPEQVPEFHDRSITEILDGMIEDSTVQSYLDPYFYPTELIPRRQKCKSEIEIQLGYDRWPYWFVVPDPLNYQEKRLWLEKQYDLFIMPPRPAWMPRFLHAQLVKRRATSKRMAIALYYKGLLSEYKPDVTLLNHEKEMLSFYNDYPFKRSWPIWYRLYKYFGTSPEALEACWRVAVHWIGEGKFGPAEKLLKATEISMRNYEKSLPSNNLGDDSISDLFKHPAESVITRHKLSQLQARVDHLLGLIGTENRGQDQASMRRLSEFVRLNPHASDYERRLTLLHEQIKDMDPPDPLLDNIELAQIKLEAGEHVRAERLATHHRTYGKKDSGIEALYELGRLKMQLYRAQSKSNPEDKQRLLAEVRGLLENFLMLYPESFYAPQINTYLSGLPSTK